MDDLMSLAEAGRLIGVTRAAIWNACERGRLAYRVIAGHPVVSRSDVLTYRRTRKKTGRPPKSAKS